MYILLNDNKHYTQRFQKTHQLFHDDFANICQRLKVAVIGLGGVGSWAAEALARMGIGHITLIDGDMVAVGNTNRQIHATLENYGQSKVLAMQKRLQSIYPEGVFVVMDQFLTEADLPTLPILLNSENLENLENLDALANIQSNTISSNFNPNFNANFNLNFNPNDYDFILDCCDDFAFKLKLLSWVIDQTYAVTKSKKYKPAQLKNHLNYTKNIKNIKNIERIPFSIHRLIIAGAAGGKTRMQDLDLASLNDVIQDPLLAKLRYQIRQHYKNINKNIDLSRELKQITCAYSKQAIQKNKKNNINKSQINSKAYANTCAIDLDMYTPKSSLNCAGFGSSLNITASMGFLMVQGLQEKIEQQLQL